ncbi:HVO_2922 family protein [Haloarcula japonica]|uniref:HVO_2922 family protein n=1 Tax=Haloarcula japonica TaxID=29282 RepID=UPI0039F6B147
MTDETVHESQETRSRRGIASYFRRLANRLSRGEPAPADEEQTVTVTPPAESEFEVEVEREDGTVSLEIEMEWDEAEGDIETDVVASKATFEVYEDSAEQYRWRLRHDNGNIIADSGEGYASKQKAEQGLESVKNNAPGAYVVDESKDEDAPDDEGGSKATFELFKDSEDKARWRLRHDNGEIIADCGQGYSSKQKAKQGLESVKSNARGAAVEEAE